MKSPPPFFLLVIATMCLATLTRPGLAHSAPEPAEPGEDPSPLPPPLSQPSPSPWSFPPPHHPPPPDCHPPPALSGAECWKDLRVIKGCVWQIYGFIFAGSEIGKECCDAFLAVTEDCWPKMFPLLPFFGPLVKTHCYIIIGKL